MSPSFYEVSSLAVLEAMALGVPAVASNTGPFPELVEDGVSGSLFPVGDAEALARSVVALLESSHARLDMGRACRSRFAEMFDMRILVQQLVGFYGGIAGTGSKAYTQWSARKRN